MTEHSDKIKFPIDSNETVTMLVNILVMIRAELGFLNTQIIKMHAEQSEDPEREIEDILKEYKEFTEEKRLRDFEDIIIKYYSKNDPSKNQNLKVDSV